MIKYWCASTPESGQVIIAKVKIMGGLGSLRSSVKVEKILYRKSHRDWAVGDNANVENRKLKNDYKEIMQFVFEVI